ncbi:phage tail protein [Limoniibacter endophyticus]|uniref:Phage tail protein n=1 Tax=Limoniibacter endophyticus TaxID=1565040 RepID=A0A8J3DUT9_9HYPH|nr:phage tail protein [Limoniibacter endophyticus]GHC79324.1 phage tail protein [Limoniibacter endophyticus]
MAIFTAIGAAIAGALFGGSALAAALIGGALAYGAQAGLNYYLNRKKQRAYTAVQGEVQFGGNVAVGSMFGIGLVKGQRAFYAKWGGGNKFNAELFLLSNGWCDGLEPEVYFWGKKHVLVPVATISNEAARYQVEGFGNKLTIRFYDGRPGQQVDMRLVEVSANSGTPWKVTSRLTGYAYAIVEREYDGNLFEQGVPDIGFILRGLRLYDPRKDSTVVGGSGTHRWSDPATWQFSQNPALQRLNYQLGLRGRISNRTLIGEGKSLGQLDLGTYFAAMNVADTLRNGKPTYQAAIYVTGDDDHTEVLKEFDDAVAGYGLNRRGLSGLLVGAPQIPVANITAADIPLARAQDLQRRKSSFDLYNHMSGQFTSKEDQWNPASLKPIYVNADIAADGKTRQTANDFLQVTDPDIAQYLLNIRYRQNRKGGQATVPVSRRLGLKVSEGEWITFEGVTWLIKRWSLSEAFEVTLSLAETGADVYSEAGIEPGPIIIPSPPPVNPLLLSTVQNFAVEVGLIEGPDGYQVPSLRFTWTPPADPTITSVRFEYVGDVNPANGPVYVDATEDVERGEYITSKNVAPGLFYSARATITTRPDRFKTWTPWSSTTSTTNPVNIYLPGLVEEVTESVRDAVEFIDTRSLLEEAYRLMNSLSDQDAGNFIERDGMRTELKVTAGGLTASYIKAIDAAVGPDSAIVQELTRLTVELDGKANADVVQLLQTQVTVLGEDVTAVANALTQTNVQLGRFSASGLFRASSEASGSGAVSRVVLAAEASAGANSATAAIFLEALSNGQNRVGILASQFYVYSAANQLLRPFIIQDGVVIADNLRVAWAKITDVQITNAQIANLTVGTSNLDFNAVTQTTTGVCTAYSQQWTVPAGSGGAPVQTWPVSTITVPPGVGSQLSTTGTLQLYVGAGSRGRVSLVIRNATTGVLVYRSSYIDLSPPGGTGGTAETATSPIDTYQIDPSLSSAANNTYQLYVETEVLVGYELRFSFTGPTFKNLLWKR